MRAAQEFIREQKFADLEAGWVVTGASKRGWATYLIGAATKCTQCVKVIGIMPLVPIVPDLRAELHRQYQAYGGFSFAFEPYIQAGLIKVIDTPLAKSAMQMIDPLTFNDTLSQIPKLIVVSSSDEFMMMDWSNIWGDKFSGESHLLILPNAEHTMATNLPGVLSSVTTFIKSIVSGHTSEQRPRFEYQYCNETGQLNVTIPDNFDVDSVYFRTGKTISMLSRDFRFLRQANNNTEPCTAPWFKLPFGWNLLGGDCVQLEPWIGTKLEENPEIPGLYTAKPPHVHRGHWVGYYIEVYFKGDTPSTSPSSDLVSTLVSVSLSIFSILLDNLLLLESSPSALPFLRTQFSFSTPGFVWPNTLPYPDCEGPCPEVIV